MSRTPKHRHRRWVIGAIVAIIVLSAMYGRDGSDDEQAATTPPSACLLAFEQAAAVDVARSTVSDLYPAALACETVEEWAAASATHPGALDGADPATFARNMCLSAPPDVRAGQLCEPIIARAIADDARWIEALEDMDRERDDSP